MLRPLLYSVNYSLTCHDISLHNVILTDIPGENPVRTSGDFLYASCSHSDDHRVIRQIRLLAAEMLDLLFILIPKIVEAQAVSLLIHNGA